MHRERMRKEKFGEDAAAAKKDRQDAVRAMGKYPKYPASMPSQADAKLLLPPHTSIWRGLANGSWNFHQKPWPRQSFSWNRYGAEESLKMCIQAAWELYLGSNGLEIMIMTVL